MLFFLFKEDLATTEEIIDNLIIATVKKTDTTHEKRILPAKDQEVRNLTNTKWKPIQTRDVPVKRQKTIQRPDKAHER